MLLSNPFSCFHSLAFSQTSSSSLELEQKKAPSSLQNVALQCIAESIVGIQQAATILSPNTAHDTLLLNERILDFPPKTFFCFSMFWDNLSVRIISYVQPDYL
ncbi:hypothetical protein MRB53_008001 [Persea americana]|uniref:Uncharacterized protein n=1 Tax=Persea americana TaxID=3435 RepID=A0ACC2MKW0_PERAE|nr:hypothetical protein MRB53_008001 [Persea americana]